MVFSPKTVLITGGGSGIGRGLAGQFMQRGCQVIIGGRRADALAKVCSEHQGMQHQVIDVADPTSVQAAYTEIVRKYPDLDCVINNAGVQRMHDFTHPAQLDLAAIDAELQTNLRGIITMTATFLPHLLARQKSYLVNISSGLAFVPLAKMPVYCATKAAVRSLTMSLRHQLRATPVKVIDIAPPAVQTELHDYMGPHGRDIGISMEAFLQEAMAGLDAGDDDIAVASARDRRSQVGDAVAQQFKLINQS